MKKKTYIRICGKEGVYILTEKEFKRALDRENFGVSAEITEEEDYKFKGQLTY